MVEATPAAENFEHRYSLLPDPIPDRTLTEAECPRMINKPLEDNELWGDNDLPDWRLLKDFLGREGPISKPQILRLLMATL